MGDLKLCAMVGAWIGPAQFGVALVVMAIVRAALDGGMKESLNGAGDLLFGFRKRGSRPHPTPAPDQPGARGMPYTPAILIGTLFSFLTF